MHLPIIRRPAPEGQVLLLGIVIMLVLLLAILFLFDIHNVIRAKFKTETAQQAAALAAANWQTKAAGSTCRSWSRIRSPANRRRIR